MAAPAKFLSFVTVGDNLCEKALRLYMVDEELIDYITKPPIKDLKKEGDVDVWVVKKERMDVDSLEANANLDGPDIIQPILQGFRDAVGATKGKLAHLSQLRTCWNDIRKHLQAADVVAVKLPEPVEGEDVDRPLDKPSQK